MVVCARPQSPTGLAGTIDDTARDIRASGGEALPVPCDVSDEGQVRDMVEMAMEQYGRIDVLVNNAGIMVLGQSILEIDTARWDRNMAVNVRGPYLTCKYVLR